MKKIGLLFASILLVFTFACTSTNEETEVVNEASAEATTFANVDELVEAVKAGITEITVEELKAKIDAEEEFLLIDVRTQKEFDKAFIAGAVNIPRGLLEFRIAKESFWEEEMLYLPKKDDLIIVCCKKGHRGALSAQALQSLGYTNVKNLQDGVGKWTEAFPEEIEKNETAAPATEEEGEAEEEEGGC